MDAAGAWSRKGLSLRALLLVAALALFLSPWTRLDRLHAGWFRFFGDVAIETVAVGCRVDVQPEHGVEGEKDTAIVLSVGDERGVDYWGALVSSRLIAYLPLVIFLSLVLVTPLDARRRWRSICWGVAILHGFLVLRLLLVVVRGYESHLAGCPLPDLHGGLWREGGWGLRVASGVLEAVEGLMYTYTVPVLVWLALVARYAGWSKLVRGASRLEAKTETA